MPPRTEVRRYYSNRSRWPFEQVGILLAARKEFAEQGGGSLRAGKSYSVSDQRTCGLIGNSEDSRTYLRFGPRLPIP